jgi:hypothetical protein
MPTMTSSRLGSNALTNVDGLGRLRDLRLLTLQHNQIASLGREIAGLRKLQTLRLDSNKLQSPVAGLPASLVELDISGNGLTSLAGVEAAPKLTTLKVSALARRQHTQTQHTQSRKAHLRSRTHACSRTRTHVRTCAHSHSHSHTHPPTISTAC